MADTDSVAQSQFLVKLTAIPVVHSAWDYATSTYGKIKGSNELIGFTLATAEKSIHFGIDKTKPIVKKFEKQIEAVDSLACKGLDTIQHTVPVIMKPTDEVVQGTKELYTSTVQNGISKYSSLKNYGINKVQAAKYYGVNTANELMTSPYAKFLTATMDGALTLTESCVNYYLPPLEDDDSVKDSHKGQPVVERMSILTNTMRCRLYKHALVKLQHVQRSSPTDLIQGARTVYSTGLTRVQGNATWLWEELNKESEVEPKTLNERALFAARLLTRQLVSTCKFATTSFQDVPGHVRTTVISAYGYTTEVYNRVRKPEHEQMVINIIQQTRDALRIDATYEVLSRLVPSLSLQWLVASWSRVPKNEEHKSS